LTNDITNFNVSRVERGLNHLIIWQVVKRDKQRYLLPVLYLLHDTGAGIALTRFGSLVDYCIENNARSGTWMLDCVRVIGLLVDFTAAWQPFLQSARNRDRPEATHALMLKRFARAVLNGTSVVENGRRIDGVGLYWPPRTEKAAKNSLSKLTRFLISRSNQSDDWSFAASPNYSEPLTAIRIAYQYVVQRNKSLLAHLPTSETEPGPSHAFGSMFRGVSQNDATYRFPPKYFWPLIFEGFRSQEGDVDEVAQLVALVLAAGGSRKSEVFHAWVQDVQFVDGEPIFYLHDPRDGVLHDATGHTTSRVAYLAKHGRVPRNQLRKRGHAGYKGLTGTELIWLPVAGLVEELAARLKHYLSLTRPRIMRQRKARGLPDHSYLFLGSGHKFADNTNAIGDPYTVEAFDSAWKRAIARISVLYDDPHLTVSKSNGTTPHALRHSYGTFLKTIGCDGTTIMRCMHHKSPFSHLRYTRLTPSEINNVLLKKIKEPLDVTNLHLNVSEALQKQSERTRFP
jgi:integrase